MGPLNEILSNLAVALSLALFVPLLAPLVSVFDKSRKHAETRRKLELIKLVSEVDKITGLYAEDKKSTLTLAAESVISSSDELNILLHQHDIEVIEKIELAKKAHSKFGFWDVLASLGGPFFMFMWITLYAFDSELVFTEFYYIVVLATFIPAILSLVAAKFVVCRFIRSSGWQVFWNFFSGFVFIFVSLFIVLFTIDY